MTNWGDLRRQYQQGKRNIDRYSQTLKDDGKGAAGTGYEERILISTGMSKEMGETIRDLKRYYLRDYGRMLAEKGESLFSKKQLMVLELRSKGFTFEEIGKRLGISKVAVYKMEKRCEKKMNQIWNAERG